MLAGLHLFNGVVDLNRRRFDAGCAAQAQAVGDCIGEGAHLLHGLVFHVHVAFGFLSGIEPVALRID